MIFAAIICMVVAVVFLAATHGFEEKDARTLSALVAGGFVLLGAAFVAIEYVSTA